MPQFLFANPFTWRYLWLQSLNINSNWGFIGWLFECPHKSTLAQTNTFRTKVMQLFTSQIYLSPQMLLPPWFAHSYWQTLATGLMLATILWPLWLCSESGRSQNIPARSSLVHISSRDTILCSDWSIKHGTLTGDKHHVGHNISLLILACSHALIFR